MDPRDVITKDVTKSGLRKVIGDDMIHGDVQSIKPGAVHKPKGNRKRQSPPYPVKRARDIDVQSGLGTY